MDESEQAARCPPNRFHITDPVELQKRETPLALRRLLELTVKPVAGDFDTNHLLGIHHYIFQDVYDWAGQIRTVGISKPGALFPPPQYLRPALDSLFTQLASELHLKDVWLPTFARRAAYYLGEINAIHAFREGNGRTQREFIRELAVAAGHPLVWSRYSQDEMIEASTRSFVRKDYSGLEGIINDSLRS